MPRKCGFYNRHQKTQTWFLYHYYYIYTYSTFNILVSKSLNLSHSRNLCALHTYYTQFFLSFYFLLFFALRIHTPRAQYYFFQIYFSAVCLLIKLKCASYNIFLYIFLKFVWSLRKEIEYQKKMCEEKIFVLEVDKEKWKF